MLITIKCGANSGGTTNAVKLLRPEDKTLFITLDDVKDVFRRLYQKQELLEMMSNVEILNIKNRAILLSSIQYFIHSNDFDTLVIDNFTSLFSAQERVMITGWFEDLNNSKKRCIIVEHWYKKLKIDPNKYVTYESGTCAI